jgi:biotin transport system substrate-specific component
MRYANKNEIMHKTLYEAFFQYRNVFTDVLLLVLSVGVMAIMANIRIPLWPVPITMQTFGVFLIAFFFGARKGVVSIILYILAGLLGLGVFAGYKSGYAALIGPTGGYLVGFIAMVFVVGKLVEKGYLCCGACL